MVKKICKRKILKQIVDIITNAEHEEFPISEVKVERIPHKCHDFDLPYVKVLDDLHVRVFFKEKIEKNTRTAEPPFITEINIIPQAFDIDRKGLVTPAIEVD